MSGWRQWQIAEVVDADDFQNLLQDQVVQVYPNATARGSALGTAVADGMVAYLTGPDSFQIYNGTDWVDVSNPGDITAVTAGTALSGGGTTGDVTLNVNLAAVGSAVSITTAQVTDITATAAELNVLDGITATTAELNLLDGVTATTAELNLLDGVTATTAELNFTDGVTSNIQTQLNARAPIANPTFTGIVAGNASANSTADNGAFALGFKGIPTAGAGTSGAYTLVADDAGRLVYTTTTRTVTIPANSSVAYQVGTTIVFVSGNGATTTIAITSDTMRLAGAGTTGSRTLAAHGMATAVKVAATEWYISGNGLT